MRWVGAWGIAFTAALCVSTTAWADEEVPKEDEALPKAEGELAPAGGAAEKVRGRKEEIGGYWTEPAPAPAAAAPQAGSRCVPVWKDVSVPCYEQRCKPVWREVEVAVWSTREVPATRTCCDPCTGCVRTMACGTTTETYRSGTRTERVFCGYTSECVRVDRTTRQFCGYRSEAAAPRPKRNCTLCRYVTVVPDGTDKADVVLEEGSKEVLTESEFRAEVKKAASKPCRDCKVPTPTPEAVAEDAGR